MNIQIKLAIIAIIVVIPLSSFAVYQTNSNQQIEIINNSKLQVISSFNPLHEFSQIVGQERVDATLLVPIGVEPHDWEPTIKDVQQLQKSDLIIINGMGFENWVDNLDENNYQGMIVDTSVGIIITKPEQHDEQHDEQHSHESGDPHIWLNPLYAKIQVGNIAQGFSNSDPQNEQFYRTNAEKYIEKLDLL